jgi:chromosome segregation ATPase
MTTKVVGEERTQVVGWIEEGRTVLESILRMLTDFDQLKSAMAATQKECERLQHDCEQLRAEVNRLKADHERSQREREDLAQWFTGLMNEASSRLRTQHPAA